MARAEALFLTPVMPAEGGNGLAMRAGLLLEGLARALPVRVVVVPVFGAPAPVSGLVSRLAEDVAVLALEPAGDPLADMTARLATAARRARAQAVHPLPSLCQAASVAAAEAVAAAAAGARLVLAMRLYLAPFLDALLDRDERPALILDVDDIESVTHRGLGDEAQAARFAALEAHYLPLFDRVLACSTADAELLGRWGARSVAVVPNAVRWPSPAGVAGRHDLLFVGNLSYAPNAAGVRWLCSEVLPRIPEASAAIVGTRPGPEVLALAADGRVTVAADVRAVSPWYAGARIAVVPLHAGGGTRIKVLEAFAHRRPVVSTSAGVAGLELDDVLVANAPAAFAGACRRLLEDPELAERTARRGEQAVRESASVEVVAARIEALAMAMLPP